MTPSLVNYMKQSEVRLYAFARHALHDALKDIKVSQTQDVLFPEFICRDILSACHDLGMKPVFFPVNEQLQPASEASEWPQACAVIAVNYFGFPQSLEKYWAYCELNDAILIEDNSHGYLSTTPDGLLLGTRGAYGLLSFRKSIILPNGAALLANAKGVGGSSADKLEHTSRQNLSMKFYGQFGLSILQRRFRIPLLNLIRLVTRFARFLISGKAITPLSLSDEFDLPKQKKMHEFFVKSSLVNLALYGEVDRRRDLYKRFLPIITWFGHTPIFPNLPDGVVPMGVPFFARAKPTLVFSIYCMIMGADLMSWPSLPSEDRIRNTKIYNQVWLVNFI